MMMIRNEETTVCCYLREDILLEELLRFLA